MDNELRKTFRDSFRIISKFCREPGESREYVTVSESYYVIHKAYHDADRGFLRNKELYSLCCRYLSRNGWKLTRDSFFDFFANTPFSVRDVFSLGSVLSCALTVSAADEIKALGGGKCNRAKLVASVLSLRRINDIKSEECFSLLCPTERLLAERLELYAENSPATRDLCREAVMRCAEKNGVTDSVAVGILCSSEGGIYAAASGASHRCLPFFAVYALLFVGTAATAFGVFGWLAAFMTVPLYSACGALTDRLFSRVFVPVPPLRLGLTEIPDTAVTLTVITTLLFGSEADGVLFERLEEFYLKNRKKNVIFGVLGDLPDSSSRTLAEDIATISNAESRIRHLNSVYGNVFTLFIRERTLNTADNIWSGRERKRGAVCDLVRTVRGAKNLFAVCIGNELIGSVKYVLTLDGDTSLPLGGVTDLVNVMLHPANRPIVSDGRVVSGFGIVQPRMKTGLVPSYSTYYSLLRSEDGGLYERAAFDRYQTVLGSGVFCGKGMFDVDLFYSLVIPAFPEGKVLSHDIPEGCILRCMYVSDVVFTDSGPKSPVSFFTRLHRWIRGDVQNCVFFRSAPVGVGGRYKLAENLIRHLTPLFSALGMLAMAFVPGMSQPMAALAFVSLQSYNVLPAVFAVTGRLAARSYTPRRFFSVAFSSAAQSAGNLVLEFALSFEYAVRSADAFVRSLWRLAVSKKRLLQWVTFSASDAGRSAFAGHLSALMTSAVVGTLLLVLSPYSVYRLFGLIMFLCPETSYFLSQTIHRREPQPTRSQKETLARYATDAYRFFDSRVCRETNCLPPDNVQLFPAEVTAERTSPSNIGLYLLSIVAAHDFGIITAAEVVETASETIATVEKLKKWNGHLYNWYDTRSLEVIGGGYVSTVDSGNFTTMLITFSEALREYAEPSADALAARAHAIADNADFSVLYDKSRELFRLGRSDVNGDDEICYDLLMSEIRTTCYYACATGIVPKTHWLTLSRAIVAKNGFIGMASWSGTAFEYFMPQLFLPDVENSFIDETLSFAFHNQRAHRAEGVWGVSESGFYSFDAEMNYQYRAHGVPALALRKYRGEGIVVSPYSSFIMLMKDPDAVMKNLRTLADYGMYGEYGFYEALDLSSGQGGIVKSYMAHHTGMIILACANACFGGVFRKRFMRDKRMSASKELLCEKIPVNVHLYPANADDPRRHVGTLPRAAWLSPEQRGCSPAAPEAYLFRGGNLSMTVSTDGRIALKCGSFPVNRAEFAPFSWERGLFFGFAENDAVRLCAPVYDGSSADGRFAFERYGDGFAFISSDAGYPSLVRGRVRQDGRAYVFETVAARKSSPEVCLYFEPVLDKPDSYNSHPAFSKLFVISSFCAEEKIILFHRRSRNTSGRFPICGVALGDPDTDFVFRTDNSDLSAHSLSSPEDMFLREYDNKCGVCVNPACVIKTKPVSGGNVTFIISSAYTEKECIASIVAARSKRERSRSLSPRLPSIAEKTVSAAFFAHGVSLSSPVRNVFDSSLLWKAGISGDYPLITLAVYSESVSCAESYLAAFRALAGASVRCELLFLVFEKDGYLCPLAAFMHGCIAEAGCDRFRRKRGGIFTVNAAMFSAEELDFIRVFSAIYEETDSIDPQTEPPRPCFVGLTRARQSAGTEKAVDGAVTVSGNRPLPRSYIISGYSCGSVVTHGTLGFTFFRDARDCRVTRFDSDPFAPSYGETLVLFSEGKAYDCLSFTEKTVFGSGAAIYTGSIGRISFTVTVYVMTKLPVKVIHASFSGSSDGKPPRHGFYAVPPDRRTAFFPLCNGKSVGFKSLESRNGRQVGFVYCENASYTHDRCKFLTGESSGLADAACATVTAEKAVYFIGACPDTAAAERVISMLTREKAASGLAEAVAFADSFIPPLRLFSSDGAVNSLYSYFAPYQAAFSRFIGRTGFYQTGGAYGFRDQLQDCLCLVYSRPGTVRTHLLRCAAHQYPEGDVMHWWYTRHGKSHGIRSACSDDLLFLPYAVSDYTAKTGDMGVLDVKVRYVESAPLIGSERFETPSVTALSESLYAHCLRAIDRAVSLKGEHGLCLMGSCDWNDGLSAAGSGGRGESVFTTAFLGIVCREFSRVCLALGDTATAERLSSEYALLCETVRGLFTGDRYPRGTFDDGRFFGVAESAECGIDIISQCFAAILLGKTDDTVIAVNTAYDMLFDRENGIFKLFSPPFVNTDAGYISAYPAGVRENGGQYTHGALWGAWGLAVCGEYAKAVEVMEKTVAPYHCASPDRAAQYGLESYVIAADIAPNGKGGWSWYTGSAAWYYKLMTETVCGIHFSHGFTRVTVRPLAEYTLTAEYNGRRLKIVSSRRENGVLLDGLPAEFPLAVPEGEHILRVKTEVT